MTQILEAAFYKYYKKDNIATVYKFISIQKSTDELVLIILKENYTLKCENLLIKRNNVSLFRKLIYMYQIMSFGNHL